MLTDFFPDRQLSNDWRVLCVDLDPASKETKPTSTDSSRDRSWQWKKSRQHDSLIINAVCTCNHCHVRLLCDGMLHSAFAGAAHSAPDERNASTDTFGSLMHVSIRFIEQAYPSM